MGDGREPCEPLRRPLFVTSSEPLATGSPRRPLRPLHGIPEVDRHGQGGLFVSLLLHAAILLVLFLPPFVATQIEFEETGGAGGPGPTGGGGGGTSGSGGQPKPERVRFLQMPAAVVPPAPPVLPPVPKPPEPQPPKPVEPEVKPTPAAPTTPDAVPSGPTVPTPGTGGGTGNDGSGGNGPGSGGGVGSGQGTGRGSGVGPGTGGGPGEIYPPQVTNLALLPIPVPQKVRPYRMVAVFDVDERGRATLIAFNPSRDGAYNRKLRDMLAEVRFRPAVRQDGTPVRDTVSITAEAPR